jgi:hypothetical protein
MRTRAFIVSIFASVFALASASHAITWSVQSTTASRVQIGFALDSTDLSLPPSERKFTFAFMSSPDNPPAISITALSGASIPAIPACAGWAGSRYLQWIAFSPFLASGVVLRSGSIAITFPGPIINSAVAAVMRNGILQLSLTTGLAKAAAFAAPALPYSSGLRIGVGADGIYHISGAQLKAQGISLGSIPASQFRLFEKERELPLYITNSYRTFMADDDLILFYGMALRGTQSYWTQFSNTNVYWLVWNTGKNGVRVTESSGRIRVDETRYRANDTTELNARDFYDTIHLEADEDIRWLGNINDPQEMTAPVDSNRFVDNWYWGGIGEKELTELPIDIPSPASLGNACVRIAFMGLTATSKTGDDHRISILINSNSPGSRPQTAAWGGQQAYVFQTDPFPVNQLKAGKNVITFRTEPRGFEDRSSLNWIEIMYPRTFEAYGNQLTLKNNPSDVNVLKQFRLTGFSSAFLDLWDLTNQRVLQGFSVQPERSATGAQAWSLLFQDSCASVTSFFAEAVDRRLEPEYIILDSIRNVFDFPQGVDYVMITQRAMMPALAPLAEAHIRRGLSVALLAIEDIYNRFSYGIKDPESIRSMIRYIVTRAGSRLPRYLLLGGDTSHDLDKNKSRAARNIVPTHLSRVPAWGPSSDDGYFGTVIGNDNVPDLFVGRLPAENIGQLRVLVDKTVRVLTKPENGPWHDNLLLAGGAEVDFSAFNTAAQQDIVGPAMNSTRLDAYAGSSYYTSEIEAATLISGAINAGVYAVNFCGHGGGNVWSDSRFFGIGDISRLYNGQWGASGRLPVVFSFTCLTGFFESVFYQSLGEEMVRRSSSGAIAFYGSSAYTSKQGDLIMDRCLLDRAMHGAYESLGELIWSTELDMLALNDLLYLPLVRQYNLLGDPALPWQIAPDSLKVTLDKQALSAGDSLAIAGTCAPIAAGQAKIMVSAQDHRWYERVLGFDKGTFTAAFPVKDSAVATEGLVRVYAWNDSQQVRGWQPFTKNRILVTDVTVSKDPLFFGDTVRVRCRIMVPTALAPGAVRCLWTIDYPYAANPDFNLHPDIAMARDSADTALYLLDGTLPLTSVNKIGASLMVKFRLTGTYGESPVFAFPIRGRPDLKIARDTLQAHWEQDSLRVDFDVVNGGSGPSGPFDAVIVYGADTSIVARTSWADSLSPGSACALSCALPDTQGVLPFTVIVNREKQTEEIAADNNRAPGMLSALYADLAAPSDTLRSRGAGTILVPSSDWSQSRRVFLIDAPIAEAQPLQTPSIFISVVGDAVRKFALGIRPRLATGDSLRWIFQADTAGGLARKTAALSGGSFAATIYDTVYKTWRYYPSLWDGTERILTATSASCGPFAAAYLMDNRAPEIAVSVARRALTFLDYAARGKPFDLLLSDPSGIDPASVFITLNGREIDRSGYSLADISGKSTSLRSTIFPLKERAIDSLAIRACDFAGNDTSAAFAYMPGEKLAIRFLACHPNPFTARQSESGATIQKIRIAYLLTDVAKNVSVVIYSMTGKKVRTWSFPDVIGYQEIEWDGKSQNGYRIGNGTYYLKMTAKNDTERVTRIVKIAKLEGY